MRFTSSILALAALSILEVAAEPSSGCGKAPSKVKNGLNTIQSDGKARTYIVHLPTNYDNKKPYRVIFAFHATGGTANQTAQSYYGQLSRAGSDSILISPQGQAPTDASDSASGFVGSFAKGITGWWRTGGKYGEQDLQFVDQIIDATDSDLCIETKLRFSTGFSFGGVMSYSLACLRADKFRAVSVQSGAKFDAVIAGMAKSNSGNLGPMAGPSKDSVPRPKAVATAGPGKCKKTDSFSGSYMGVDPSMFLDKLLLGDNKKPGAPMVCSSKPVPYLAYMGQCDGWIKYGREARDDLLKKNGCKPKVAGSPVEGSKKRVVTDYECIPGFPVTWVEWDGGHGPTREAEEETFKFFSQFK